MKSDRAALTPHMLKYAEKFDDRGDIRWLPYLMYFHPTDHVSDVVNTDRLGFRVSHGAQDHGSVGGRIPPGPIRLLVGSSTAFGIGATNDSATLPSRLWSQHAPNLPWLNFAGRSHNSTQELLLFTLYRHLLPEIAEIVIFSGFNDLGLARLPRRWQGDHGAFFNCTDFYQQMDQLRDRYRRANSRASRFRRGRDADSARDNSARDRGTDRDTYQGAAADDTVPDLAEQIANAAARTLRHLDTWRLLAEGSGARLTYVLQPLATWVRDRHAPQEVVLFRELDQISDFGNTYGDIAQRESGRAYAESLRTGCHKLGVRFHDINPVLADAANRDDWLFVDRIHFTDEGHDLVAALLADLLDVS